MTRDELLTAYAEGKRDFRGADLGGADLGGADLRGADLGGADLRGADLRSADLRSADLRGANLRGANLRGANLGEQWIAQGATRSDGYFFMLTNFTGEGVRIKAGCRDFALAAAWQHWTTTRGNTPLGDETIAIVNCLIACAKGRGYDIPTGWGPHKE